MRCVREPLARGWSLDQFPHPRNPQKRPINREIQGFLALGPALLLGTPATSPSSLSFHSSFAGHALRRRSGVAAPRVARQGEAWRPGLDLNQDKERCTALASTHSATGPVRSWPRMSQTGHLYRELTLTGCGSAGRDRLARHKGHAPGVMADIAQRERGGKSGSGQLLLHLVLAIALQPDARAQLAIVRQRG